MTQLNLLTIKRIPQSDLTLGILNFGNFRCFTLELPDLDNKQNVSCIPKGTYLAGKHMSPSKGHCVAIKGVPMRSNILIHVGNYTSDILGCILVGDSVRDINNDGKYDVTNSRNTFNKLMDLLPDEFLVRIE